MPNADFSEVKRWAPSIKKFKIKSNGNDWLDEKWEPTDPPSTRLPLAAGIANSKSLEEELKSEGIDCFNLNIPDHAISPKWKNLVIMNARSYGGVIITKKDASRWQLKGFPCWIRVRKIELPNDFLKFFKLIEKFNPDLIIGSRFIYSEYTRSHNFLNKVGNKLITFLFNIIYNTTFTDIYSCYICFKKDLLNVNSLKADGFEGQAELLCKIVKKGNKFFEIPINYNGRNYEEGKKIKFYHIFGVIFQILIRRIL